MKASTIQERNIAISFTRQEWEAIRDYLKEAQTEMSCATEDEPRQIVVRPRLDLRHFGDRIAAQLINAEVKP